MIHLFQQIMWLIGEHIDCIHWPPTSLWKVICSSVKDGYRPSWQMEPCMQAQLCIKELLMDFPKMFPQAASFLQLYPSSGPYSSSVIWVCSSDCLQMISLPGLLINISCWQKSRSPHEKQCSKQTQHSIQKKLMVTQI